MPLWTVDVREGELQVSDTSPTRSPGGSPLVAVVMGSDSDLPTMGGATEALAEFAIPYEVRILSAHRTIDETLTFTRGAADRGLKVIVAGAGAAQVLDVALVKLDVRQRIAVSVSVPRDVAARNLELLARHVDPDHPALGSDQAGQDEAVPAAAAAEIEHRAAFERRRQRRTATVEALADLGMNVLHQPAQVLRHGVGAAAGTGL